MTRRRREELRRTFGTVAEGYDRARPAYPRELVETAVEAANLQLGSRAIEVGCGTGQLTEPLARLGIDITAVELSDQLARVARHRTRGLPVRVVTGDFEQWPAATGQPPFDAVLAATSWHWIDPDTRYERAWQLLRPGGHLATWSATHVFPEGGDPFFREIQEVYDAIGEGLPPDAPFPRPGELTSTAAEAEASGRFRVVTERQFDWEVTYDADGYLALLDTFSGHIAMQPAARRHLYREIRRRLGDRPGGTVRRHWGAALMVAIRNE